MAICNLKQLARPIKIKPCRLIMIYQEDDDLGVIDEVLELQHVFSAKYKYDASSWRIPKASSFKALRRRLTTFLDDFEGKEALLIVYYGGRES